MIAGNSQSTPNANGALTVGVADMALLCAETGSISTYALGSCIGITVFDPVAKVGGMLHFMLPQPLEKTSSNERNGHHPDAMFATTGIPALFREAYKLGAQKERLIICAAGGAAFLKDEGRYQIGKRNKMIMRKLFWKNGITLNAEDTGGNVARTMLFDLASGEVLIRSKRMETALWSPKA